MIPVLIIDDEPLARGIIVEFLSQYPNYEVVGQCGDGFEGFKKITELKPTLIFLDIQMPKITGFEMLEMIDEPPAVIFTTASDDYALKAFDSHAIDYLLKPFSAGRFDAALRKWEQSQPAAHSLNALMEDIPLAAAQTNNRIVVKEKGRLKIVPVDNVNYIEACGDFVKIYTNEGILLKSKTMNYFENTLDASQFVRIHRSYIINIAQITKLELYEKDNYIAILKTNGKVPVSKTGYQKLKLVMGI
jgi:two-component system, LytTR family, response regulator